MFQLITGGYSYYIFLLNRLVQLSPVEPSIVFHVTCLYDIIFEFNVLIF
jgi:hypothetical protein